MAAKTRRTYAGAAASTTIASGINSGDTTISLTAATGWAAGPFYVVIDPGTSSEEKVYISSRSTTTLTVGTRGVDGTTAKSHSSGAVIYPVHAAIDSDEANELTAKYTTRGDIVYQGASTFERLGVGAADYVLKTNGTDPSWGQVGTAGIAAGAITTAKIAVDAVTSTEIAANAVTATEIAADAVITAKILDGAVTSGKILDANVTLAKLATAVANSLVPVGTIAMYGGASAPTGWLLCNGDAIAAGYTALKAIVGNNTPDLKGRFALGDNATLDLLGTGGSTTIGEANLPAHSHANTATASTTVSISDPSHSHTLADMGTNAVDNTGTNGFVLTGASADLQGGARGTASASTGITATASTSVTMTNAPTGSGTAYYPPYVVVNYIIKHD